MLGGLDTIKGGGDGSYWDRTIEVLSASYGPTTRTILRKEGYIWLSRWIHAMIVAYGIVHSRGIPLLGPRFLLFRFFRIVFSLVLTLWLWFMQCLNFDFFFFHFCLLLQIREIRWFYESPSARRGGVFLLLFFPSHLCLGTLGVFTFLAAALFCGLSLLERSKMGTVFGYGDYFSSVPRWFSFRSVFFITGGSKHMLSLERVLFFLWFPMLLMLLCSCSCSCVVFFFLFPMNSLILYRDSVSFVFRL